MPEIRDGGSIPEELMREAQEVAREFYDLRVGNGIRLSKAIARALMSARKDERERAARIVREGREVRDPLDNFRSTIMVDWEDMGALAAAILSDKEQSHAE